MMLQKIVDSISYPPTHTYNLNGIEPTGVLAERLALMNTVCPQFFRQHDSMFLDVGCNKGFFSLLGAERFFTGVVGIDTAAPFVDLCQAVVSRGTFIHTGFRDFIPEHRFGRVMIANGHHHLFKEAGGWGWIVKLAVITQTNGLVLVEGIPDESNPDGAEFPGLSEEKFLEEMAPFFVLEATGPTASYTPGRKIWTFRRKPRSSGCFDLDSLTRGEVIRCASVTPTWNQCDVARCEQGIRKVFSAPPNTSLLWPRIEIANLAAKNPPLVGWIFDGGLVGWIEQPYEPLASGASGEDDWEALDHLLQYGICLAQVGYADPDFAWFNVMQHQGHLVVADIGSTRPIAALLPRAYNYINGAAAQSLRRYPIDIPEKMIASLCEAYASKNSQTIEVALRRMRGELDCLPH